MIIIIIISRLKFLEAGHEGGSRRMEKVLNINKWYVVLRVSLFIIYNHIHIRNH